MRGDGGSGMQVGYSGAGVRTVTSMFLVFGMMLCAARACAAEVAIQVDGSTVTPPAAMVRKGDSVRWVVVTPYAYTISSYDRDWTSPRLTGGNQSYARDFSVPGDYTFRVSEADKTNVYNFVSAGQIVVIEDKPEVLIHSPVEHQIFNTAPLRSIEFRVSSTSALAVAQVELLSGDHKVSELTAPPFDAIRWTNPPVGRHSMRARFTYADGSVASSPPRSVEILPGDTYSAHLSAPTRIGMGEFRVYYTLPTYRFFLEYTDDLKTWQRVLPQNFLFVPAIWVDETATNSPTRFYRLAHEPG